MTLEAKGLAIGGWAGAAPLLEELALSVSDGGRVAVVGPSGSGKTTLLRALALLDDPVAGTLTLDGRSPAAHGYPRWRHDVTYVSQRAAFFGTSVADELARPFGYATASAPFDPDGARTALDRLGLGDKWSAEAQDLSEGEAQRVALLRAALPGPRVLLLDEPTSALDPERCRDVEAWLAEQPFGIVLVSHDAAQRARVCSETLSLEAP